MFDNLGLAGLLLASGKNFDDALLLAAQENRQQQLVELEKQKQLQQQQAMTQAADLLSQAGGNQPVNQLLSQLIMSGIDPRSAAALAQSIAPNPLANTFEGPNKTLYQAYQDPSTQQLQARPIPGQVTMPTLSKAEERVFADKLNQVESDAKSAQRELRILEDLDDAYKAFDKNTGFFSESGSLISKLGEKTSDNLIYNEKARGARQKIDKLNALLFQNRVTAAGSKATDSFKEEVKKSLPSYNLTPEARKDVILTKRREAMEQIARNQFYNEWKKLNNRDLSGAEEAFYTLFNDAPFLDESGRPNKALLKSIPEIIRNYAVNESMTIEPNPMDDFSDVTLEQIDELIARKRQQMGQ